MYRKWTEEEVTYLKESWGTVSLDTISKKLNRSKKSILGKKQRLKLGAFLDNGEYISVHQLMKIVGYNWCSTKYDWIDKNIPMKHKKINHGRTAVIKIDDFWKWAEENQASLNFSKFQRYSLGKEPAWVDEKRKRDIRNGLQKNKKWTKDEEELLVFLVKEHRYTYDEIAKRMNRTEYAIANRLLLLNIKDRPIPQREKLARWKKEDVKMLKKLIKKGYDYVSIQREFLKNKTTTAIKAKVYNMYNTSDLDKVRKIIDKEIIESSYKRWTDEEKQILQDMAWEGKSYLEIQKVLSGRSREAIRKQIQINNYERGARLYAK